MFLFPFPFSYLHFLLAFQQSAALMALAAGIVEIAKNLSDSTNPLFETNVLKGYTQANNMKLIDWILISWCTGWLFPSREITVD